MARTGLERIAAVTSGAMVSTLSDEQVVERVFAGEIELFEVIMRRYNQRLYRVARGILGEDSEAEDVMQEAYVRAFSHLRQFAGRASFATWLTKIAVYEALARARRRGRVVELDAMPEDAKESLMQTDEASGPEVTVLAQESRDLLEAAVEAMPMPYRAVFTLRTVEGLNTAETAAVLGLTLEAVKTRLHRAHALLRKDLARRFGSAAAAAFPFAAPRCDRVVAAVLARIRPS